MPGVTPKSTTSERSMPPAEPPPPPDPLEGAAAGGETGEAGAGVVLLPARIESASAAQFVATWGQP